MQATTEGQLGDTGEMVTSPVPASAAVATLPLGPGVYRFVDDRGRTLYIGRAVSLRRRVRSYFGALRDRPRLRRMVAQIGTVEAIECDSEHEAWWLERNLLERAKPRWNRARGGQEATWYIRLDERTDGTGLKAVHDLEPRAWAEHFGPFLGGQRVRSAVSALERLFPLRYASGNLRGATLEMARIRQVVPADRERLLSDLRSVLRREQTPVYQALARLGTLRNEASERLAFESAGRLQEEHEGLQWVTAEQKVTSLHPNTMILWGRGDEVGVRLDITGGILNRWRVVSASDPVPRGIAETPPQWQLFLGRAVRLAALLRGQTAPMQ